MRVLALILALLPSLAFGAASHVVRDPDLRTTRQAKMRPLRWASPVAARYRFESTGGDWGAPVAPTIDCRLSEWSSGTLDCGGAVFTPSGSPTAGVPTYWRPGGGDVGGAGVSFDGVDDRFTATSPTINGSFTICVDGAFSSLSASPVLASEWGTTAPTQGWILQATSGGGVLLAAAGIVATTAAGTAPVGTQNAICASFSDAATNTVLVNANGVTASGTGTTEITASTADMVIGALANGTQPHSGSISRVTLWSGWAASASDLARLVRSQYVAQGSLGEPVTVTGPATSAVLTKADGSPFVATTPANTPSIVAGGVQVYPAHIQSTLYPNDLSQAVWTKEAGVTYEAASASCPIGPDNARMTLVTAAPDKGIYQAWTHAAQAYTLSAWLARATADADCTMAVGWAYQAGLGFATLSLTGTPQRLSRTATTAAAAGGIYLSTRSTNTCTRFCVWGANETNTSVLMPYANAAASPLSVAATSLSAGHGIADPNRWCIAATVTPASSSVANHGYLWTTRTAGAANTASLRLGNGTGACEFNVYDSAGTQRAVAFACDADRHRYTACDANGALSISIDGSVVGTSSTGGTGMLSALGSTLFIGSFTSGASAYLNGAISSVVTCNTASPEECQ